jgi:hypothetical protein
LGATFYELLTLEPIFRGRDVQYLLNQILHTEPKPLRQIDKTIPVEIETIILKAVSKNPDDRYRSAGALAADLQRYLDHQPILARRPTVIDRMRKWSLRHPGGLAAGMVLLFLLATGLLVSNQMISQEQKKAEQRAVEAEQRFLQAKQAVDMLIEVCETELADNWMMQPTRQRLLATALTYYQDFIEQRRGDKAAQGELAAEQERVKGILHDLKVLQRDIHVRLVEWPKVQVELSLADDQKTKLDLLLKTRAKEHAEYQKTVEGLDEDARRRKLVEMVEDQEQDLEEVLHPDQRERLAQIALQFFGTMTFRSPEVVDTLKLTSEQRKAMRAVEREAMHVHQKELEAWWKQRGPRDREAASTTGTPDTPRPPRPTRESLVAKVLTVLTPEQLKKWQEMVGAPFTGFDEQSFRGPGDRGPPRDGERRPKAPAADAAETPAA